jgi:hypothetical protein
LRRRIRRPFLRFASTRGVLAVLGALAGMLAYQTYYGYTTAQLPVRDLCVILLISTCVCGVGSVILPQPTAQLRSWIGLAWMAQSVLRASGFATSIAHRTTTPLEWVQQSSAVTLHCVLFFLGLIIWTRAYDDEPPRRGGGGGA